MMLRWLRRRQDARRLVQADAEALIRDYGPEFQRVGRFLRKPSVHLRRVVRMTGMALPWI